MKETHGKAQRCIICIELFIGGCGLDRVKRRDFVNIVTKFTIKKKKKEPFWQSESQINPHTCGVIYIRTQRHLCGSYLTSSIWLELIKQHSAYLRFAPREYLCVLCGSENKQQLFPYTALTDWFLQPRRSVYCAVRTGSLYIILRSAHTVYLCVLCGSENKQRLFPYTA